MSDEHRHDLEYIEEIVRVELVTAESSQADRPPVATDADLPFVAWSVQAYEIRLAGIRDALDGLEPPG